MLSKFLSHFVAPRAQLAGEKFAAALSGRSAFRVLAENMEPTLPQNSIWTYRPLTNNEQPEVGSILVFTVPEFEGHAVPSRLIAVGGDRVQIEAGKLFRNGHQVPEPYVKVGYSSTQYSMSLPECTVPAGSYFLLGDNRDASKDSRALGSLHSAAILGVLVAQPGEA